MTEKTCNPQGCTKINQRVMDLQMQKSNLRAALDYLLDCYLQVADNACLCDEYRDDDDPDSECPYCNAKTVLNETR